MHQRRSIRLPHFDYTSEGGYFITIVAHRRQHLFGKVVAGEMHANHFGAVVHDEWFRTAELRPFVELFENEFIVMPNHIHGIIWLTGRGTARRAPTMDEYPHEQFGNPVSGSIPTIVRAYKSAVSKNINEIQGTRSLPVWQRNYFEHIISTDREYENIVDYIESNPHNWLLDEEYLP